MPTKPAPALILAIDAPTDDQGETLTDYALSIARSIARTSRLSRRSQEEQDLEGVALLELVRLLTPLRRGEDRAVFDLSTVPAGGCPYRAFKGYAHQFLRSVCIRQLKSLRNGGLVKEHGHEPEDRPTVHGLPTRTGKDGIETVDLIDYREPADPWGDDYPDW